MTKTIALSAILILVSFAAHGQRKVIIDSDILYLMDSLAGNAILLCSIQRGSQNEEALWITITENQTWIFGLKTCQISKKVSSIIGLKGRNGFGSADHVRQLFVFQSENQEFARYVHYSFQGIA